MNRRTVATWIRSLPLTMPTTSRRSSPAMSWSDVLRTASSKAKFGAAEKHRPLVASSCIQRAGRRKNDIGLINIARRRATSGAQIPRIRPIS
ncbi:Uncharacterised protein [Mycobacterium tuberculosis]|nr:Uncharacterised protein [Mycobacterium tuberculosis]